jgi:Domain of unknown function (DUF4184)
MPFTLSHAAAVLPVRRVGFVISAFVVGTFGPDFEYFLLLAPRSSFGHRWPGVLYFTIPACLFVLWLLHALIKRPAAALLPPTVEQQVAPFLGDFCFGGVSRFCQIVLSLSAGIGTHLLWDSFTHQYTWATRYWPVLLEGIAVPSLGVLPWYKVLQHSSTIVGLAALTAWFVRWLRASRPMRETEIGGFRASQRLAIVSVMTVAAGFGAAVRTFAMLPVPTDAKSTARFVVILGVTAVTIFSVEMLAYAVWWTYARRKDTGAVLEQFPGRGRRGLG